MKESSILLDKHLAQTTMFPFALEIEKADGIYIIDKNKKNTLTSFLALELATSGTVIKQSLKR
jgi:hypothetical protein